MKKNINIIFLFSALATFASLFSCNEYEKDKIPVQIVPAGLHEGLPAVTTSVHPESITATRVIAEGNVTIEGNAPVIRRGFEITDHEPDPWGNRFRELKYSSSGTGKFTYEITGLWPGNSYRVRAYAANSEGISYGNIVGFSTPIPEVKTDLVTIVSQTVATVVGSVTLINNSDIGEKGICYGTSPAPTTEGFRVVSTESGTFTCSLQNLIPGTQYYVRAYVSGNWNYVWPWWGSMPSFYGNEIIFTAGEAGSVP